jgi:hypothetical protein
MSSAQKSHHPAVTQSNRLSKFNEHGTEHWKDIFAQIKIQKATPKSE